MNQNFKSLLMSMRPKQARTIAIANAIDANALQSVLIAKQMGFATAILCGPKTKIQKIAQENNIDISDFEIINCDTELDAAKTAVSLARENRADIVMKGLIHTADVLRAALNRETGIRKEKILSHTSVMYSPKQNRTLFLTDMAMVTYPDLETKIQMVKNTVKLARAMGVETPRVAPVCAVETINPAMQPTLDAEELRKMNKNHQITGCLISGPMGLDVAISEQAAKIKGITGPVTGNADVLLFANIEAGNNTVKSMVHFGDWIFGGVVIGAKVPIIINSRSDDEISKLFSIACACMV